MSNKRGSHNKSFIFCLCLSKTRGMVENMRGKALKRIVSIIVAVSMMSGVISGCNGKQEESMQTVAETENKDQSSEESSKEILNSETASTTGETSTEETMIQMDFMEEKEKLVKKLEEQIGNLEVMKASSERDIYEFFLDTLQVYYEACGDYTTEESTIGDLITSNVADTLSGGSSTISSSIQAAAKSIKKNGVTGELVTDAFAAAMEELPEEIVSNVMEFLLGGTIIKALNILKAAIPQNEQTQHLINVIDKDIKGDIYALSAICQKQELTVEDCYKGDILIDSIIRKSSMIEHVTGINAGSFAWSITQGKSWIGLELANASFSIQTISSYREVIDILEKMEEIPAVAEGEYEEYLEALENLTMGYTSENDENKRLSLLKDFGAMGKEIMGAYDTEDAEARSKSTNLMNSVNMIIGNPISDIYVHYKNAEENIFADAINLYNTEVIPLWKERYIPLAEKTEHICNIMNIFDGMFMGASPWGDTPPEIKIALTKEFFGGLPSLKPFEDKLADMSYDMVALSAQTRIMESAYRMALSDSETNTKFLEDYYAVKDTLIKLCVCTEKENSIYLEGIRSDDTIQKTAKASRDLVNTYVTHIDKRTDFYIKKIESQTTACGKMNYSLLYKNAGNGTSRPTICRIMEKKEGDEYGRFYYLLGNNQNCYWVSDKNKNFIGFPGYFPAGGGIYFQTYPDKITDEIWRPVILAEHGENISMALDPSKNGQYDAEALAEELNHYLTADVEAVKAEMQAFAESMKQYKLIMEAYEKKITELQKKTETGEELWLLDPDKVAESFMKYYLGIEAPVLIQSEDIPAGEFNHAYTRYEFENPDGSSEEHYWVTLVHPDFIESERPVWTVESYRLGNNLTDFETEKYMESLKEP